MTQKTSNLETKLPYFKLNNSNKANLRIGNLNAHNQFINSSDTLKNFSLTPTTSNYNFDDSKILNESLDLPADIDLDGGTLLSVEKKEEIDPEDNCKVQITCYHILSADGTEESTITKRRKLKVNCTQSLKRVEFLNGKELKVEEKTTVLDNIDALNNYSHNVVQYPELNLHINKNDNECLSKENQKIDDVLLQTQKTFISLLNKKKDQLVFMFPDLFSNLRTQPAIFQERPSTIMETIVNPDGSTTTHTKSSKAFSSRYTCQETYLNGIRQNRTAKFRAFMEYAGPEGGFSIKLNDDADLSESEEVECIAGKTSHRVMENANTGMEDDKFSRISRSGISEIPETASTLVTHVEEGIRSGVPKIINVESMRKKEKAWHAVNELVESEGRYVQKLVLLEKFREVVEKERLLDKRQMSLLFANIESLYRFHNDHLLPQLMDRRREWHSTQKISDVMRKQAPFLKMYSAYTNNYKAATQTFEECLRKKKHFEEIVRKIESLEECENLSLVSHLICPVQRVMRYQLLLKEYQRYLNENDVDYLDTQAALTLVLEAASHANEMMQKLDRYRNVLEVQEQLGNSISLVSPSRELLIKTKLYKISSTTNKLEERFLIVFNDLFLLVSERTSIGLIGGSKYKLRAIFDAYYTQICEGDNFEREYSFYLRGSDISSGPLRCVELCCSSQTEKNNIFDILWSAIDEIQSQQKFQNLKKNYLISKNENNNSDTVNLSTFSRSNTVRKCCARCDLDFSWYSRGYVCSRCLKRFCKQCFGRMRLEGKSNRLCSDCLRFSTPVMPIKTITLNKDRTINKRNNLLAQPADDHTDAIKFGYIFFKSNLFTTQSNNSLNAHNNTTDQSGSIQKYFVLRKNFCLYLYKTDKDKCASAMLPISGCDISPSNSDKLTFVIRHMNRVYNIQCSNELEHAEWLAALILSANAKLPNESAAIENLNSIKPVKRSASVGDRVANAINNDYLYIKNSKVDNLKPKNGINNIHRYSNGVEQKNLI